VARALAVLVLAGLLCPAVASAHARLVRTVPVDGAVLAQSPRSVVVEFDDTVRLGSGNAAVANASRRSVLSAPASAAGRVVTLPLARRLPHGEYTARWSVVSEDGHREQGVLAFAVGLGSPTPHAVLSAAPAVRSFDLLVRTLYYLGVLVGAGTVVFGLLARPLLGARLRRPVAGLLFASLVATFVGASGLAADAAAGTRFARVLEAALLVSLVGAAAAALAPIYAPLLAAAGACALALTAAPALSGHSLDRGQPRVVAPLLDLAHTLAAAVWLGGLVAALWVLPRAARDSWERRAVLRRFSSAALVAVCVLAVSGIGRAATELGPVHELWTTSYGWALLAKSAAFIALLAVGALNRSLLERGSPLFTRSVAAEIVAVAAVVVVVGILTQLRPGREAPDRRVGTPGLVDHGLGKTRGVLERREP
jgi:copper transport protein